jgi:hypothetical protein
VLENPVLALVGLEELDRVRLVVGLAAEQGLHLVQVLVVREARAVADLEMVVAAAVQVQGEVVALVGRVAAVCRTA